MTGGPATLSTHPAWCQADIDADQHGHLHLSADRTVATELGGLAAVRIERLGGGVPRVRLEPPADAMTPDEAMWLGALLHAAALAAVAGQ